jgi:hypothetical protein
MLLAFNFFNGNPAVISRPDGIVLLAVFAGFMWYSFYRDRKSAVTAEESVAEDKTPLWLAIVKVAGGLALLVTSCDFFVDNAVLIAKSFGVNDAFISLTLIACGTSLPELAASIAAAVKKNTQMALGNIVGSNIFNITLILGLSSQVMPLTSAGITAVDYIATVGDSYKREHGDDPSKVYRECGLLVLDDIGAHMKGEWQQQELFRLINKRMEKGLITIYTSNSPIDGLNLDDRTKDRILKNTIAIHMPEESVRQTKAAAEQGEFLSRVVGI